VRLAVARTIHGLTPRRLVAVFPVFLKLEGRRVLVVGAGPVAAGKLRPLVDAGAQVTVVAPDVVDEIAAMAPAVAIVRRPFEAGDLDGAWYVVAAAPPEVNRAVAHAAEARCLFVNAVDDLESASAYAGAIVQKAGVTIAMSTDGEAPALAGLMREALEELLPDDLDKWMACAQEARREWLAQRVPMAERRPMLLEALNELYERKRATDNTDNLERAADNTDNLERATDNTDNTDNTEMCATEASSSHRLQPL
jgi:uroporphyrin-III C-methyltransferase / precorrin-2 dehydrogenase / sirohydrochlorin ferrochelatase